MRAILAAACLAFWVSPAAAASFDCAKAATPVEKMICADPALSAADEKLASTFGHALGITLDPQNLRDDQRRWIGLRNKLETADALATSYRNRIAALERLIAARQAMPDDVAEEAAKTGCVALPEALDDKCEVAEFGAVANDKDGTLRYQLQDYKEDDGTRMAGGAVVLETVAGKPGRLKPIASAYGETVHYGQPALVTAPMAVFLQIPGGMEGTGDFNAEALFLFGKTMLRDVDSESWLHDLARRLPRGLAAWKGIYPDYAAMTAGTPLWRGGDANCCPTGGYATIRLGLKGDRLTVERVAVELGADAARRDRSSPTPAAPAAASADDADDPNDLGTDLCGKAMSYEVNLDSFKDGDTIRDKPALDTVYDKAPVLIHRAFKGLCARKQLSAAEIARRIDKVVFSWAGGATDFNAYFPSEKQRRQELTTEWLWQGTDLPEIKDVRSAILCAFRPQQKMCRLRGD